LETIEINRLQNNLTTAMDRYRQALDNLESTQLASAVNESNIRQLYLLFDAPQLPTDTARSLRSIARDMLIYALLGILLTVVGLFTVSFIDRTFRFPEDIEHRLGLPVITSLPLVPARKR
jgi:capsular polysaccharide biosynthesis protein